MSAPDLGGRVQVKVRLPLDLKRSLKLAAAKSCRSLTAEVLHRLKRSFEQESAA